MDERLKALPAPIREIAERIEDTCRCEIEIRRSASIHTGAYADARGAAAIECSPNRIKPIVLVFGETELDHNTMLHELLHLHRYAVDKIPQIHSTGPLLVGLPDSQYPGSSGWLENRLEHFHIHARMKELGYDQASRLDSDFRKHFADTLSLARSMGRKIWTLTRWGLLLDYATVRRFCSDTGVKAAAEKSVSLAGLREEAQAFDRTLSRILPDKPTTVFAIAKGFGIDLSILKLAYFNTETGTVKLCPVEDPRLACTIH